MSNENLIQTIDELRSRYNQQKRTSNNLMAALKSVASSLTKATRMLEAYPNSESTIATTTLDQTRQTFADLQIKETTIDSLIPELRREVKAFTAVETALKDVVTALTGSTVDVIRLDHALQALQKFTLDDAALTALLPQLDQELQQAQRELGNIFGSALRDSLAELGITIGGRPPRFEIGRFEVLANFVTRKATISYGKDITKRRVPLSVDAVIKAYQSEVKAVMGRQEDAARWIAQLHEAWTNVRRKRDTSNQRANIVECYLEMTILRQPRTFRSEPGKSSFRDYTRAQFAYDFCEFALNQQVVHEGMIVDAHTATKAQAESTAKSIWIVTGNTPHEGGYIGDIEFKSK